jgi:hypothetical protein
VTLYHGSDPLRRASILRDGLKPGVPDPGDGGYVRAPGVYLATTVEEARYFGRDVWEVDASGLDVRVDPDSYNENGEDDNYYAPAPVGPARVRLAVAA